jgi:salicylate hydroxylase
VVGKPALSIAVCGAGPAGLAAALLLHRDGHKVRLLERFDTARPVGSGLLLQPTGLAVLHQLGLDASLISRGARISRLHGTTSSGKLALDVRYGAIGPDWCALGVHRAVLFEVLHSAVQAEGIQVECGTNIGLEDRRLVHFDLVVDAMGAKSSLSAHRGARRLLEYGALWVNLPWPGIPFNADRLEQRYHGSSRMAGVMPVGWVDSPAHPQAAFFWSLRRRDEATWLRAPLAAWCEEVAALWPAMAGPLSQIRDHDACTFAVYDHFTRQRPYDGRMVQIGDAAHATSPQLGQGANMALLDAFALALALRSEADLPNALERYARMRRWHVRLFQMASALFTPFYQSDGKSLPFMRDQLLAPLTRVAPLDGFVARLVAGMTVAPLRGEPFQPLALPAGSPPTG